MPLARSTGMGSTFDCADHSKSVCFFESAIISSPVIGFFSVSVAIYHLLSLRHCKLAAATNWTGYLDHEGTKDTKVHEEERSWTNPVFFVLILRVFVSSWLGF